MKKKWITAAGFLLAVVLAAALCGCASAADRGAVKFRLYDDVYLETEFVTEGGQCPRPRDPWREGYDFTYWMLDGEPYDFTADVRGNMTLTAGWRQTDAGHTLNLTYVFGEDELESKLYADGDTALLELIESDTVYKNLSGEYWAASASGGGGVFFPLSENVQEDMSLTVSLERPYQANIFIGGQLFKTVEGIRGDTLKDIESLIDETALTTVTYGDKTASAGKIKAWCADRDLTDCLSAGSKFRNGQNIFLNVALNTSAYTLGFDVGYTVFEGETRYLEARENRLSNLGRLLSNAALGARVVYTNNNVDTVTVGDTVYKADTENYYWVTLNGVCESDLNTALNGVIEIIDGKLTFVPPEVRVRVCNREATAAALKAGLKEYFASEDFVKSLNSASSTQARVPFMYLKYVDADIYTDNIVENWRELILDKIDGIMTDGKIDDALFPGSAVKATGWYGYIDFLYTWSLTYQQYNDRLLKGGGGKNPYQNYLPAVEEYLNRWVEILFTDRIYARVTALKTELNRYGSIGENEYADVEEYVTALRKTIDELLPLYDSPVYIQNLTFAAENLDRLRLSGADKTAALLAAKVTAALSDFRLGCGFSYSYPGVMMAVYANLGLTAGAEYRILVDYQIDTYYAFGDDGTRFESVGCNWVGFSGGPLTRTLLLGEKGFDLDFEKAQQGYYPYTDKGMTQQGLSALVNFDRLYDGYNGKLQTSSGVDPRYPLLTMYAFGIDPEHYVKAVETENFSNVYNLIPLWLDNLKLSEGKYAIGSCTDMAVAIAYLARAEGVTPTPLGVVTAAAAVVTL